MVERLIEILCRTDLGLDEPLSAVEIADIIWLAAHLHSKQSITVSEINPSPQPRISPSESNNNRPQSNSNNDIAQEEQNSNESESLIEENDAEEVLVIPESDRETESSVTKRGSTIPFSVPAATAIPHRRAISRALRFLNRKVPSKMKKVLDRVKTIEQSAEEEFCIPVLKPALQRWLDVVLVVETSPGYGIWQKTIKEFKNLLLLQGSFRNVKCWYANYERERLVFCSQQGSIRSPKELILLSGDRLIIILSDCVSAAWSDDAWTKWIKYWGKYHPTTVLQMLPPSFWRRTALGNMDSVWLDAKVSGFANHTLNQQSVWHSESATPWEEDEIDTFPLPIATLDPYALEIWAKGIAGISSSSLAGVGVQESNYPFRSSSGSEDNSYSSEQLFEQFMASASPTARRLAALLSAVPIQLPIIRLVQRSLLATESNAVHIAEIFFSGILHKTNDHLDPEKRLYDFEPGLRAKFRETLPKQEIINVIDRISIYIARRVGVSLDDFRAMLFVPSDSLGSPLASEISEFARISKETFQGLGKEYADFIEKLQQDSIRTGNTIVETPSEDSSWKLQQSIENNQGQVNCIAFSPDGKLIASAENNGTVCLWDLQGNLIHTFEEHQDKVLSLVFSADGKSILSEGEDKSIKVWQITDGLILQDWKIEKTLYSVDFSSHTPFIAYEENSEIAQMVEFIEIERFCVNNLKFVLPGCQNTINRIVFTQNGLLLASCHDDCTIRLWSYESGDLIKTLEGHSSWVNEVAFSPNEKTLVSGSSDQTLRLWTIEGECLEVLEGHQGSISSVVFHPNGEVIASGSEDGTVRIWNLQGDCLEVLTNENQTNVRTVAFNPEGTILACGGEEQPIHFYSQETTQLKTFTFDVATVEVKLEFDVVTIVSKDQVDNRPQTENIYFKEKYSSQAFFEKDRYQSYQELIEKEHEGIDYLINYREGNSDIALVAHHGGKIQPGTTEIADAIAGKDFAFYSFEGIKQDFNNILYISSHQFDEPIALDIVSKANQVITIHSQFGNDETIYLGGLDNSLKEKIKQYLEQSGFRSIQRKPSFKGTNTQNICNRGVTGRGVQIGISWGLRKKLFDSLKSEDSNEQSLWNRFIQAIRDALSPLEAAGWRHQTTKRLAGFYTEDLGNNLSLDMISIPSGKFMMGFPIGEINSREVERPVHSVVVSGFYIGRYPITQAQWKSIARLEPIERKLKLDPSYFKKNYEGINRLGRPVERISWEDAQEFCRRLSKKTGKKYRLPTEAEWEYSCRAKTTTPFHFGETITTELANYNGNYSYEDTIEGVRRGQTTIVGYFKVANNFGLSDVHGNVWEWCEDDWHENYQGAPEDGSAWLSQNGQNIKVLRGGSWGNIPHNCRSAHRSYSDRNNSDNYIGFRVVCVDPFSNN